MSDQKPDFRLDHTMIRVFDQEKTLDFCNRILGMKILRQNEYPEGRFTNTFIGYQGEDEGTTIEMTYNWDREEPYDMGNAWGHLALKVLNDTVHVNTVLDHNARWIETLTDEFNNLGLKPYPSQTNFVLVGFPPDCARSADESNEHLNSNCIIPRQFAVQEFSDELRFTVGTDNEMHQTIEVMQ